MRDLAVSEFTVLPPPPVVPLPRDDTGEVSTDVSGFVNGFLFTFKLLHLGRWVFTAVRAFGRLREPYKGRDSLLALRAHPQGCVLYGRLPTHGQSQRTRHKDLGTPRSPLEATESCDANLEWRQPDNLPCPSTCHGHWLTP